MPQQMKFFSYNIIRDDQRDRLKAIAVPIISSAPGNNATFNTYSLYQHVNSQSIPVISSQLSYQHNQQHKSVTTPSQIIQSITHRRKRDEDSDHDLNPRLTQRRRHKRVCHDLPPEQKPDFLRKLKTFKEKWNTIFPDRPCVECGTLLLPRH